MLLLAAFLALQAAPAPPPVANIPTTSPAWPPFSLFSDDDYPAAALRANEEGDVGFHLDIGTNGRVSNCTIRRSSGSPALDASTCRILTSRARFAPGRDTEGNAVPDSRDGEISWRLPPDED
jgi:protein TonB